MSRPKRTRSQIGRLSSAKGKKFEREVARRLRAAGLPARRCWQPVEGHERPDIDADPLMVECKHVKSPDYVGALMQAQKAAGPGTYPVAVVKKDTCDAVAVLFFDDLLEIVEALTLTRVWGKRAEP